MAREQAEQVEKWFSQFDNDNGQPDGVLSRDEFKQLLHSVTGLMPSEEAMDVAMAQAKKSERSSATGVTREDAAEVVSKVAILIKEESVVSPIFQQADKDNSGHLDESELLPLMRMVAKSCTDHKDASIDPEEISTEDVAHIMALCDKDQSGTIEKSELLLAMATWKDLLQAGDAPHQKKKRAQSSACALL